MAFIEYTKYESEYLITDFNEENNRELKLCFCNTNEATLIIDKNRYEIENGVINLKLSLLNEGVHTPYLRTDRASFKCDEIRIEAGCVAPNFSETKRAFLFTKSLAALTDKLCEIEEDVKKLSTSVYGCSIL